MMLQWLFIPLGSGDHRDYYYVSLECTYRWIFSNLCGFISIENDEVVERQKNLILRLELNYHYPGNLSVTVGDGEAVVMIEEDGM